MRLTTLARKIQITPSKLIEYLKKNDIAINNGVNTILDSETVAMVLENFSPTPGKVDIPSEPLISEEKPDTIAKPAEQTNSTGPEENIISKQIAERPEVIVEVANKLVISEAVSTAVSDQKIPTPKTGTIDDLEQGLSEDIELIKAKKVKLEGIKVIGKIDIPEKVKKVHTSDEESKTNPAENELKSETAIREDKQKKKFNTQKRLKADKNRKSLTYEERLKLEEREKLRLQKQKARKEKERKKKYYLKNIQPKVAVQPAKKKKKVFDESHVSSPKVEVHKNPLRRFWDWLNGVYDKY